MTEIIVTLIICVTVLIIYLVKKSHDYDWFVYTIGQSASNGLSHIDKMYGPFGSRECAIEFRENWTGRWEGIATLVRKKKSEIPKG